MERTETQTQAQKWTERGTQKKKRGLSPLKTDPIAGTPLFQKQPLLSFERRWTRPGVDPLAEVATVKASSSIKGSDGRTVFAMKDLEVPADWSQLATDIVVSKYFRKAGVGAIGHETSVRQVVKRIAHTIRVEGEKRGYFDSTQADTFEAELAYLLVHQMGAFNSPVWFNLGLWHEYGIEGSGGNYRWDAETNRVTQTLNAYEYPQCSACFIQAVDDDLMAIFDLAKNEARLFKYGSGTGTNFSKIRGRQEKLSGGGLSSGLMSFLEVFDRGAGATKSGGTTRRAAKMVCLDIDHPEIEDFLTWKSREEKKARALIAAGYESDFNGEAYRTVGGQNSNNSIRVTDEFMRAMEAGGTWQTRMRTTGDVVDTLSAQGLWRKIAQAAWECADPGIQYDTTINDWHTCSESGPIRASNPCSEYMFLDNTACNLASLNLVKFLREDGSFDIEAYRHAVRVFIVAQDILVDASSYPNEPIAKNSHDYRPLGLGYANLGTLLMIKGIPYDSDEGRAWAAALTAILCGHAYAVSAEEAGKLGAFAQHPKNARSMLRVIRKHRDAIYRVDAAKMPQELAQAAREDWDRALELGEKHGYRNSQVTVLAPTGTIGLLMDCDTTGIEPDFALVKFKKLAGGGYFKIVNQSVPAALRNLGYSQEQMDAILRYVLGTMEFSQDVPHLTRAWLIAKGFSEVDIERVEETLPGTFEISSAFNRHALGEELLARLGVSKEIYTQPTFNFLTWAGLTSAQIRQANEALCGTMTLEGAPGLKPEHLPVFDCANKCGEKGKRFIEPMGHIRMMAAVQPFLSGAISKTVNLPSETTVEEIEAVYTAGWKLGLKAVALYRDGCKSSQPLSTKSDQPVADTGALAAAQAETQAARSEVDRLTQELEALRAEWARSKSAPAQVTYAPVRRKLPTKRRGFTQEASVGGHKIYLRTGEYEDGLLGEVFIDMHKEGAAYRSMMNCFAIAVSLGLQYGVPLKEFVDKFTFTRFEPSGIVEGHPNVKLATSLMDYIFRVLGMEYLGRTDFLQVKPKVDALADKTEPGPVGPKEPSKLLTSGAPIEGVIRQMELSLHATQTEARMTSGVIKGETLSVHLADMMGDAPPCDQCGHTTVRNGACYRCLNCGNSMGCS